MWRAEPACTKVWWCFMFCKKPEKNRNAGPLVHQIVRMRNWTKKCAAPKKGRKKKMAMYQGRPRWLPWTLWTSKWPGRPLRKPAIVRCLANGHRRRILLTISPMETANVLSNPPTTTNQTLIRPLRPRHYGNPNVRVSAANRRPLANHSKCVARREDLDFITSKLELCFWWLSFKVQLFWRIPCWKSWVILHFFGKKQIEFEECRYIWVGELHNWIVCLYFGRKLIDFFLRQKLYKKCSFSFCWCWLLNHHKNNNVPKIIIPTIMFVYLHIYVFCY